MWPTLQSNQLIFLNKSFAVSEIARGDIVVFSFDNQKYLVKRVVGLPGERLKLANWEVSVRDENGQYQVLEEPYLKGKKFNYGDERFFIIPQNSFFLLGDNRLESKDSRYFPNPYIGVEMIKGVVR